jgi:hypothetical protein
VADIFDETMEDLRNERMRQLAVRYGGLLVVALVLVLIGAGAWQGWRWYQGRQAAAAATAYLAAMRDADALPPGPSSARGPVIEAFAKIAASGPAGYRTIARLREAALQADAGDLKDALALWDQISGDSSVNPVLRDLASLLWVQHQIDQGDPGAITARLQPLEAPSNPWRPMAQEASALLALRQGNKTAALSTLRTLATDPLAPQGVRSRAGGMVTLLNGAGTQG